MSLAFICPQCGKHFEVSQSLGGKRAKCKQCGVLFRIPFADAPVNPQNLAPDPYGFDRSSPNPKKVNAPIEPLLSLPDPYGFDRSPSTPKSSAPGHMSPAPKPRVYEEPAPKFRSIVPASPTSVDDPYGLDEPQSLGPLPSRQPRETDYEEQPVSPLPINKKKRSVGFFGSAKAKSSNSGGSNTGFLGLSFGGVVSVILVVVRVLLNQGYFQGISSRATVDQLVEQDVRMVERITEILKTVHDAGTANEAGQQIVVLLKEQFVRVKAAKDKKARKTDIEAVQAKYRDRQIKAIEASFAQFQRVAQIPGAPEALAIIQGPADELAALEREAGGGELPVPLPDFEPHSTPPPQFAGPINAGPAPQPGMVPGPPPMPPRFHVPYTPFGPRFGRPGPRFGPRMLGPRMH